MGEGVKEGEKAREEEDLGLKGESGPSIVSENTPKPRAAKHHQCLKFVRSRSEPEDDRTSKSLKGGRRGLSASEGKKKLE